MQMWAMRQAARRRDLFLFMGAAVCAALFARLIQAQNTNEVQKEFAAAVSDYESGQFAKAASELESLTRRLPSSFRVQELLGLVYSAESRNLEANLHFRRAVQLRPGSAAARANLAINLSRLGRKSQAEAEFKQALRMDPGSYQLNENFGQFCLRSGKLAEAVPYLAKAENAHPTYENGYNLALAYFKTGRPREAKAEIQGLLKTKDTAGLHSLLGEVDEKLGDFIAAANEYQQAARMDPTESNIFDWGAELLVHHTLDPALEVFSEGVKRYPDSPRLEVGLGLAYYWHERFDDAVKALLRAIDLSPSDPRVYYFLSEAYGRAPSQAPEVIEHFRRFAELRPRDGKAQFYYAMSLWKGNETATSGAVLNQVEILLKKAASLDPELAQAHFALGSLNAQEGKFQLAVREYERAIKLDPNNAAAHYRLGQMYMRIGRRELAQQEFQVHQRLYRQQRAESIKEHNQIRKFVYSLKSNPSQPMDKEPR